MSEKKYYKLLTVRYARVENGVVVKYPPGSVVDLTDAEAAQFGGKIQPYSERKVSVSKKKQW